MRADEIRVLALRLNSGQIPVVITPSALYAADPPPADPLRHQAGHVEYHLASKNRCRKGLGGIYCRRLCLKIATRSHRRPPRRCGGHKRWFRPSFLSCNKIADGFCRLRVQSGGGLVQKTKLGFVPAARGLLPFLAHDPRELPTGQTAFPQVPASPGIC